MTFDPTAGPEDPLLPGDALMSLVDEVIHHGAEVGVLRDLYRRTGAVQLPI